MYIFSRYGYHSSFDLDWIATSPGNAHDAITLLFILCYTLLYYAIKSYFMRTKTQIIKRKLKCFA